MSKPVAAHAIVGFAFGQGPPRTSTDLHGPPPDGVLHPATPSPHLAARTAALRGASPRCCASTVPSASHARPCVCSRRLRMRWAPTSSTRSPTTSSRASQPMAHTWTRPPSRSRRWHTLAQPRTWSSSHTQTTRLGAYRRSFSLGRRRCGRGTYSLSEEASRGRALDATGAGTGDGARSGGRGRGGGFWRTRGMADKGT